VALAAEGYGAEGGYYGGVGQPCPITGRPEGLRYFIARRPPTRFVSQHSLEHKAGGYKFRPYRMDFDDTVGEQLVCSPGLGQFYPVLRDKVTHESHVAQGPSSKKTGPPSRWADFPAFVAVALAAEGGYYGGVGRPCPITGRPEGLRYGVPGLNPIHEHQ
jgi:hypothetical protein